MFTAIINIKLVQFIFCVCVLQEKLLIDICKEIYILVFVFKLGGPIWIGQLYDPGFVGEMLLKLHDSELATSKRIIGMLTVIQEELNDVPLYYTVESLCSKLHCQMIPLVEFR